MHYVIYFISLILIYFYVLKPLAKLFLYYSSLFEGINEDICDIKKHLGLPASIRTYSRRHKCILNCIKNGIIANKKKEEIIEDINSDYFGDPEILGRINIKTYDYLIETMREEAKRSPNSFKGWYE